MPPNLEEPPPDSPVTEIHDDNLTILQTIFSPPLSDVSLNSDVQEISCSSSSSNSDRNSAGIIDDDSDRVCIPLEHNLKELLIRVTNTEELETVTQVKLRVISREITLQNLNVYVPALRELTLDGSIVSSLRDLGAGLKNLKLLKANNCQINCIDGVFNFDELEELYLADNAIEDITPCAFLFNIKIIDFSRNKLNDVNCLSYLSLCNDLENLSLVGNELVNIPNYKSLVTSKLPSLKILDGCNLKESQSDIENLATGNNEREITNEAIREQQAEPSTRHNRSAASVINSINSPRSFTISFPPRLILSRPSSRIESSDNRNDENNCNNNN